MTTPPADRTVPPLGTRRTTWPAAAELQRAADRTRRIADLLEETANAMGWLAPFRPHEPGHGPWTAALALARDRRQPTVGPRPRPDHPHGREVTRAAAKLRAASPDGEHLVADLLDEIADVLAPDIPLHAKGVNNRLWQAALAVARDADQP